MRWQCDVVGALLRGLPSIRVRRFVRVADEWEDALRSLCTQWQIQGWGNNNACMVWTGAGQLIGDADDFIALLEDKYSMNLDQMKSPTEDSLSSLMKKTATDAAAEVAGRGKFVVPSSTRDSSMVKVLMVKPNSSTPIERLVRENVWKEDMDKLLGKSGVFSDGVELKRTRTCRVFAWVDCNAEFSDRANTLATLALGGCNLLAQQCFRYSFFGTVVFYTLEAESNTPIDYASTGFDEHFETPEMLQYQQEAAAVKIQAINRGAKSRKSMLAEKNQQDARFRGDAKRQEMQEEADAAVKIQSRFRGHKMRAERKEEEDAATRIQAIQRGKMARRGAEAS